MDDMLGKMGAILSDPESVQQLQELAQMLQQETGGESQGQQASAEKTESGEGGETDEIIRGIQCGAGKRTATGSALRQYRFLFHLTKNLTTYLSHNLCAVLP